MPSLPKTPSWIRLTSQAFWRGGFETAIGVGRVSRLIRRHETSRRKEVVARSFMSPSNKDMTETHMNPAEAPETNRLLAYVADLELEVDRLRRQGTFIEKEATTTLLKILRLCTGTKSDDVRAICCRKSRSVHAVSSAS